jgi:hypothetical protein
LKPNLDGTAPHGGTSHTVVVASEIFHRLLALFTPDQAAQIQDECT